MEDKLDIVIFKIVNKDNIEIKIDLDRKVYELRDEICKKFNIEDKFCKIECLLDFPIRKFGILTLNPGELGDIYDHELLDRFNIGGKIINININFEKKRQNKIIMKKKKSRLFKKKEKPKEFIFNKDDFPPL